MGLKVLTLIGRSYSSMRTHIFKAFVNRIRLRKSHGTEKGEAMVEGGGWGVGFKRFSFKMTGNINNAINISLYPLLPLQVIPSQLCLHLDIDCVISLMTLGP